MGPAAPQALVNLIQVQTDGGRVQLLVALSKQMKQLLLDSIEMFSFYTAVLAETIAST